MSDLARMATDLRICVEDVPDVQVHRTGADCVHVKIGRRCVFDTFLTVWGDEDAIRGLAQTILDELGGGT